MKTIIPSTKISISENNVLAVIGDQKLPVLQGGVVVSFEAHVISSQDYSPFGVTLSGRSWSEGYRYGFNGKEKDPEGIGGGVNTYDYGFRIYNSNLAKFLSTDPLTSSYPWNSTYAFAENRVIDGIDLDGCEYVSITRHTIDGVTVQLNINKVVGLSSTSLSPPITETVITHNTNPAGQVSQSTTIPTTINGASADSQAVINDVNNAGVSTTQARLRNYPNPIPIEQAQRGDWSQLANVLGGGNVNVENVRIPVYNQFNDGALFQTNGAQLNFAGQLTNAITQGNLSPNVIYTVLPGNVSRVMVITDGTPANVANAIAIIGLVSGNFQNISFSLVSAPNVIAAAINGNPNANMNSVGIILNPTSDGTISGSIPAANYVMPFTSSGIPDQNGMSVEPQMNGQGIQSVSGTPIQ